MREISSTASISLMNIIEKISTLYSRIVDSEQKASKSLDIKYIHSVVIQIGNAMDGICMECPLRSKVKDRLNRVKLPLTDD